MVYRETNILGVVWRGKRGRAVFVDELKCVGCLKCAVSMEGQGLCHSGLIRNTLCIRLIKHSLSTAFQERSDLASLEFLMSKQPRGNVRVSDWGQYRGDTSLTYSMMSRNFIPSARMLRQNPPEKRLEYQPFRPSGQSQIGYTGNHPCPWLEHLNSDSPSPRKQAKPNKANNPSLSIYSEEYWIPTNLILPEPSPAQKVFNPNLTKETKEEGAVVGGPEKQEQCCRSFVWFGAIGEGKRRLEEHIGGSLALDIVNSKSHISKDHM
ncbi:hypothetical protein RJ641_011977, partial [Dillenia turbinata]